MNEIYLQALFGGALIGLGAFLLLFFNGKIAGISGIASQVFTSLKQDNRWRLFFLVGLIAAPLFTANIGFTLPTIINGTLPMFAAAGLLVGIGTKLGSGCTSGHGICGIGRLSKRSIIATCIFMVIAVATVAVIRHVI